MFRVVYSESVEKETRKLTRFGQKRIIGFEHQLEIEPFSGKPLGYKFIREKKFNGKRLLFLVYPQYSAVYLVIITDKKFQQRMIDKLKESLPKYEEKLKEILGIS